MHAISKDTLGGLACTYNRLPALAIPVPYSLPQANDYLNTYIPDTEVKIKLANSSGDMYAAKKELFSFGDMYEVFA